MPTPSSLEGQPTTSPPQADARSLAGTPAAGRLLHRAADLLPAGDRDRIALLSEAGAALSEAGEFEPATALLEEAIERGGEVGDDGAVARARLSLAELRTMVDPRRGEDETRRVADELIPLLERLGDELGLARAWRLRATAPWFLGQWGEMQEALEQSLVYARRAESPWEERLNLDLLATAITFGPIPAPEALRALKSLRPEVAGGRSASVTPSELILLAMQGRIEEARRIVTEAVADAEALGNLVLAARYRMDARPGRTHRRRPRSRRAGAAPRTGPVPPGRPECRAGDPVRPPCHGLV